MSLTLCWIHQLIFPIQNTYHKTLKKQSKDVLNASDRPDDFFKAFIKRTWNIRPHRQLHKFKKNIFITINGSNFKEISTTTQSKM